ncbi:MAG: rhodanese-like domain-containing protein [Methanomicrobiaceae archaeon]|nr:rhodanese-like domain-containing protein [Methanomicrobiaceae archaeon]
MPIATRRPGIPVVCLLIASAALMACCVGGAPADDVPGQIIETIPPADARTLIEEGRDNQDPVIIDVRRPDEYAGGHIEGAVNIESSRFQEEIGSLDPGRAVIIYCQSGGRSAHVREVMRDAGFREVYEIEGGIAAWRAQGYPVVR